MVFGVFLVVYNVVLVKKYMGIFLEPRESALGWAGWIPFAASAIARGCCRFASRMTVLIREKAGSALAASLESIMGLACCRYRGL